MALSVVGVKCDMADGTIAIAKWETERADPDYDDEDVDYLVYDEPIEIQGIVGNVDDDRLLRVETTVEESGEQVDYTVDLSESLLQAALEHAKESDAKFVE